MTKLSLAGLAALALIAAWSRPVEAKVQTKPVDYKAQDTPLKGFMAWDAAVKDKRPGVLVIHEWWGNNQHAHNQAIRLAKAGYVALAVDMYGKGKTTTHPKDAQAMMEALTKDPAVVKARFDAALEKLKSDPHVDPTKIGVVGYCMGGAIAIGMARAGEDVQVISTFHAALPPPSEPTKKGTVKPRILVNTGADDPFVPQDAVDALRKDFTAADVKYEVISYPGAKHAFTNPDAKKAKMDALAYNAEADKASWEATMKLFKEVFGS